MSIAQSSNGKNRFKKLLLNRRHQTVVRERGRNEEGKIILERFVQRKVGEGLNYSFLGFGG